MSTGAIIGFAILGLIMTFLVIGTHFLEKNTKH
jgi:hypothetical protein